MTAKENRFKYNGFEEQTELDWGVYDYQARYYDPAIGRFLNVDPLADKFSSWSTYNYAYDNPIRFTDSDGMEADDEVKKIDDHKVLDRQYDEENKTVTITEVKEVGTASTTIKTDDDGNTIETTNVQTATTTSTTTINEDGEIVSSQSKVVESNYNINKTIDSDGRVSGFDVESVEPAKVSYNNNAGDEGLVAQGIIGSNWDGIGAYRSFTKGNDYVSLIKDFSFVSVRGRRRSNFC